MKVIGTITGVLRDKDTGEITKTFEACNHIQDWWLKNLCNASVSTGEQLGEQLFIGNQNPGKQRRDWSVNIASCRGGATISGITPIEIIKDYAPGIHLGQYIKRFNAPAADYTIHIAGICESVNISDVALNAATVVWLETPCIQTTTETLDLYYRIQMLFEDDWDVFKTDNYSLNSYEAGILADFFMGGYSGYLLPQQTDAYFFTSTKYNGRRIEEPNVSWINASWQKWGGTGMSYVTSSEPEYYCRRITYTRDIQAQIGKLLGSVGTIVSTSMGLIHKLLPAGFNPLQSVFGHRSTSVVPFYSTADAQLGLGTLTMDGQAWTDPDYPKYVRMDITTGGALGVGEYQFRVRNHFGFIDNTFVAHPGAALYFTQANNNHFYNDGFMWAKDIDESVFTTNGAEAMDRSAMSYAYPLANDPDKVFVVWKNEFAVCDIHTGEGPAITNTTLVGLDVLPNFQASDISQVAEDSSGNFYISCRNTGMYKLNAALDTLTVIDSSTTGLTGVSGCKAVCIGYGGRLWAYWDHTTTPDIYYSDDSGATWVAAGFSQATIDANPELVFNIQADVNNVGGQLGILYYTEDLPTSTTMRVNLTWWDHALTTNTDFGVLKQFQRTTFYTAIPDPYGFNAKHMNFLKCSPNQSYWGCTSYSGDATYTTLGQASFLTFGTATVSSVAGVEDIGNHLYTTQFIPDAAGNDAILYITDRGSANGPNLQSSLTTLVSNNLTYEIGDSTGAGANGYDGSFMHCYLKDGVWLNAKCYTGDYIAANAHSLYFLYCGIPAEADLSATPAMQNEFTPLYGWTGSAWVKGDTGAKLLHAAVEEVIDGVTVSWDDTNGPFLDSDHYTFGLYDGVWLDGSTQFDFRWDLYSKPSTFGTDVEAATLPVVTKVSNNFIIDAPDNDVAYLQDAQSTTLVSAGILDATGTGLQGTYSAGARSLIVAVDGTAQSFLPNQTYIPGTDTSNCQGYIEFQIYSPATSHLEMAVGLSPIGVIGTALDYTTIAHALHFDSVTPGNGVGTCTVTALENGVVRATVTDIPYNSSGIASQRTRGRIALLTNGSVQYEYWVDQSTWVILYTSPPGSVTIEDLYFDMNYVPISTYGLTDLTFNYLDTSNPDYYLYLGDGVDQGVFQPEFFCVDPVSVRVTIDGTEAVHIGVDDTITVLPANSYSVYPHSGVIRYSALDAGKSVTAQYITVHHE